MLLAPKLIPTEGNMIHLLRSRATRQQLDEMLEALTIYIKVAVDIRRGILAGGGVLHADCETALLDDGSPQEEIWGGGRMWGQPPY